MKTASRSALSTLTACLAAGGFTAHKAGRNPRPGYQAMFQGSKVPRPGLFVMGDACEDGEFARICDYLTAQGYTLTDAFGGQDHVSYGVASVR